jgi:hypothetical protein
MSEETPGGEASATPASLDAVVTGVERLSAVAERMGAPRDDVQAARQFLEYKVYAVREWAARAQEVVRGGVVSILPVHDEVHDFPFTVSVHRDQMFALRLILDSYLFSAGSVRDALLQLVNVTFRFGIGEDDMQMGRKLRDLLGVAETTRTGLEPWLIRGQKRYRWLGELEHLRNVTTHRRVIRVPAVIDSDGERFVGAPVVELNPRLVENVDWWTARVEARLYQLVAVSLRRLTTTLRRRPREASSKGRAGTGRITRPSGPASA